MGEDPAEAGGTGGGPGSQLGHQQPQGGWKEQVSCHRNEGSKLAPALSSPLHGQCPHSARWPSHTCHRRPLIDPQSTGLGTPCSPRPALLCLWTQPWGRAKSRQAASPPTAGLTSARPAGRAWGSPGRRSASEAGASGFNTLPTMGWTKPHNWRPISGWGACTPECPSTPQGNGGSYGQVRPPGILATSLPPSPPVPPRPSPEHTSEADKKDTDLLK